MKLEGTERTQAQKAVVAEFSNHKNSVVSLIISVPSYQETIAGSLRVSEDCTPIEQFNKVFKSDIVLLNCSYTDSCRYDIALLVGSVSACWVVYFSVLNDFVSHFFAGCVSSSA
jgi:hypothetical protein